MKNWRTLLPGIALALVVNTSFAAPQVVDKVAAVVNNGVVLESDVDGMLQSVKLNAKEAGQQVPDDATLRHQILERLIMDQIVLQMGQKMGVKISDEQLDQAIANIAKQNNMSMDQIQKLIQSQLSSGGSWTIKSVAAEGTGDSQYCYSMPGTALYVMQPNMESVENIKALMQTVQNGEKLPE